MPFIWLSDGRRLGYAEYGAPEGKPVFFFHGTPGSRLFCHPDDAIATALGAWLIVPDRPGMGLSDFKPGLTLLDWAVDVAALADALGLGCFAVAGFSGGGPYAAACGYSLSARVTAVGFLSSVGPLSAPDALTGMLPSNRMGYRVGRWLPWWAWRRIFRLYYGNIGAHPEKLAQMGKDEPPADWDIFAQPGVREMFTASFAEAFCQGTDGVAWEGWLLSRPWGFRLEEITVPTYLWQGEDDVVVTPAMGRYLAAAIPNCTATFLPGEGHLLFIKYWKDILEQLTRPGLASNVI